MTQTTGTTATYSKYYLGLEGGHNPWVPQLEVVDWEMSREELNHWDEVKVLDR